MQIENLIKENFQQFKNNHNKIIAILNKNNQLKLQLEDFILNNKQYEKPIWLINSILNNIKLPFCLTCRKTINI